MRIISHAKSVKAFSNLSSFYLSDLVRFSFSTDFNFSSINANNYYNQKLNYFSFFIPLKNYKKGLGFSVSPYYRINSNIIENNYNYLEGGVDSDPLLV